MMAVIPIRSADDLAEVSDLAWQVQPGQKSASGPGMEDRTLSVFFSFVRTPSVEWFRGSLRQTGPYSNMPNARGFSAIGTIWQA